MNFNNFKLAYRSLLKHKMISITNVIGLSIGLSVSTLIFFFVYMEQTKDSSLRGIEDVYVITDANDANDPAISSKILGVIEDEVPELGTVAYYNYEWSPQVFLKSNNNNYKVEKLLVSSENFFKVLQFPAAFGNLEDALQATNKIVLTKEYAQKIFGNNDPVGKTIEFNATYLQNELLEVSAVVEIPGNSSWKFDAVIPASLDMKIGWYKALSDNWGTFNYSSICRLHANTDVNEVKNQLANLKTSSIPSEYIEEMHFSLVPFSKAYFYLPELDGIEHGQPYVVSVVLVVGILIFLLACLNFINLSSAQREKRSKNYNIISALGSSKRNVIALFTSETALLLFFSVLAFMLLMPLFLEIFNLFSNEKLGVLSIFTLNNMVILGSVIVLSFILTGIIPAFLFIKYSLSRKNKSSFLRNGLLVFQFMISIVLISSILIIRKQNNLLSHSNPGFTKDKVIYATTNEDMKGKHQALYSQLREIPEISDFTFSSEPFGSIKNNWGTTLLADGKKIDFGFMALQVSPNFFDFFDLNILQGKEFDRFSKEKKEVIVNQKAIDEYNIKNIFNARVQLDNHSDHGFIIGEVADFNMNSLKYPLKASGFICCGEIDDIIYLKINASNAKELKHLTGKLNKVWQNISPDFSFEYKFLDESWSDLYAKDLKFQQIIEVAALISIFLSCLGLIALTYFALENRTKEIGIRRVNGAKVSEILTMLNKDFVKWVAIAFVIACPIAYYAMSKWLENFAYKTELSWWIFALAGFMALSIALITVMWQSWRAATRNPVEALRYE